MLIILLCKFVLAGTILHEFDPIDIPFLFQIFFHLHFILRTYCASNFFMETTMDVHVEEMSPFHKHWPKHTEIFDDEVCIAFT